MSSNGDLFTVVVTSVFKAPKWKIWNNISTFQGVNYELFPFLRMTCPEPNARLSIDMVTKDPLFRSWLLLFGFLPIEFDLIRIDSIEEGTSFKERSSMFLMQEWHHDRSLESVTIEGYEEGCTKVIDKLSFRPRIFNLLFGYFLKHVVKFLFTYRHYRLASMFGRFGFTKVDT